MPISRALTVALVGALALGAAAAGAAAEDAFSPGADGVGDPYVPTEGNGGYQVLRYDLDVKYAPARQRLVGTATIRARATQNLSSFNLDLYGLGAVAATVDGASAPVNQSGEHELTVQPPVGIAKGATFTTVVEYRGTPDLYLDPDLGASGWFTTSDGAIVVGEPEAGMFWFPVNEHPSDKARLCVDATVPKGLRAVANGLPAAPPSTRGGWTTWSWCAKEPMASYLATLAIGTWRFDRSRTHAGIPVLNFVDRGLPKRVDRTLGRAGEMVDFFADRFGSYPFESAGGIADNHASDYALENQTRPTYDEGTARWSGLDTVVAHEIAHQWFGDSVALERWRHIWLNEGFATYGEWMWIAHDGGPSVADQFDDAYSTARDSAFWHLQVSDPGYPNLFDAPVYYRGAMALHALRLTVGTASFWRILKSWARIHEGGTVTTSDFTRLSERVSGRQLDRLFRQWLVDPDKPPDPR